MVGFSSVEVEGVPPSNIQFHDVIAPTDKSVKLTAFPAHTLSTSEEKFALNWASRVIIVPCDPHANNAELSTSLIL